jgi:hypothetical protein
MFFLEFLLCHNNTLVSGSRFDPDSATAWILIRIGSGFSNSPDPDSDQEFDPDESVNYVQLVKTVRLLYLFGLQQTQIGTVPTP